MSDIELDLGVLIAGAQENLQTINKGLQDGDIEFEDFDILQSSGALYLRLSSTLRAIAAKAGITSMNRLEVMTLLSMMSTACETQMDTDERDRRAADIAQKYIDAIESD